MNVAKEQRIESELRQKAQETTEKPGRIAWLWMNMEGVRGLYIIGILGTVIYNAMQLVVPYFSQRIVDEFLTGENAAENLTLHRDVFINLLIAMVGLTIIRVLIVYFDCMTYEDVSQRVLYRVRNILYDKIQRQDMKFYNTYRTGDLMTRVTGDLDAVRHMLAWVIRMIVEAAVLVGSVSIYFFMMNWKLALSLIAVAPFILGIIVLFKNRVAACKYEHHSPREYFR